MSDKIKIIDGSLEVKDNLKVTTGNLDVASGNLNVQSGNLVVHDGDINIMDGNLNVVGTISHQGMPIPTIAAVGEYATVADFPVPGEQGVIYIATLDNLLYRWDVNTATYEQISRDLSYYYRSDSSTTAINYTFINRVDQTYTQNAASIRLTIPADVEQGFEAGCVVRTGGYVPSFAIENLSSFRLNMIQYGRRISTFVPGTNSTITFLLYNDNLHNNLLIYELADA